jgi:hypothetical protein
MVLVANAKESNLIRNTPQLDWRGAYYDRYRAVTWLNQGLVTGIWKLYLGVHRCCVDS